MNKNLNMKITAQVWAKIVIEIWLEKIKDYDVKTYSGNLVNSFYYHVHTQAEGNPDLIKLAFEYYGKFVDLGVGKHVTLENLDAMQALNKTKRKSKPWFSDVFYAQVHRLGEIMAQKYAEKAAISIVANIADNADIQEKKWETL